MPRPPRQDDPAYTADRLHSAAIHLLRRLRAADDATGLSAPRLSALSVIVFGGPLTLGELAAAEQVRPPTITRVVRDLERLALVRVIADPADGRVKRVAATAQGRRLLDEGRRRRVATLTASVDALDRDAQRLLARAVPLLERLGRPSPPDAALR